MSYAHAVGGLVPGNWTGTDSNIRFSGWSTYTPSASARGLKGTHLLSPKAASLIGENGIRRFNEFSEYPSGWDGISSRSLNPLSVASCDFFANSITNAPHEPSIFMTRRGNLQLGWEAPNGGRIELEFLPNKIEFLIGDDEGFYDIDEINLLTDRLGAP